MARASRQWEWLVRVALGVFVTQAGCGPGEENKPPPTQETPLTIAPNLPAPNIPAIQPDQCRNRRIAVKVVLPDAFTRPVNRILYTGKQPITFGVPFPVGCLPKDQETFLRVQNARAENLPSQFTVTSRYPRPDGEDISKGDVRWLLVDAIVPIVNSTAPALAIDWISNNGPTPNETGTPWVYQVEASPRQVRASFAGNTYTLGDSGVTGSAGAMLGYFPLYVRRPDGKSSNAIHPSGPGNSLLDADREFYGPVRSVVKTEGEYFDSLNPSQPFAKTSTRVRLYRGLNFARIYHTIIWNKGAVYNPLAVNPPDYQIERLAFLDHFAVPNGLASLGIDGKVVKCDEKSPWSCGHFATYSPTSGFAVVDVFGKPAGGKLLDGWVDHRNATTTKFVALRWPWQQFPTAMTMEGGRTNVRLIAPTGGSAMGLDPPSVAATDRIRCYFENLTSDGRYVWNPKTAPDPLKDDVCERAGIFESIQNNATIPPYYNYSYGGINPRGIAKTYEIMVWLGDSDVSPLAKNELAQQPVTAYADPAFATLAALPSPASPVNRTKFPVTERAIENLFTFMTGEHGGEGDFGTWNYGDTQWSWAPEGFNIYRYWMASGKGWPTVPWLLWLRSGDPRYLEFGEKNGRHIMDVHVCHVGPLGTDKKIKGGMYAYNSLHWSFGPLRTETGNDTEFLSTYYYMTGYERALDVLKERIDAISTETQDWNAFLGVGPKPYSWDGGGDRRKLFVGLWDFETLYEELRDKLEIIDPDKRPWLTTLRDRAELAVAKIKTWQDKSGHVQGHFEEFHLEPALLVARRALGASAAGTAFGILANLERFYGNPTRPGTTGEILGPQSLWTLYDLVENRPNGDAIDSVTAGILRKQMAQTMRAQALTVLDAPLGEPNGENGPFFIGRSAMSNQHLGPKIRSWLAAMASLENGHMSESVDGAALVTHFNSNLIVPTPPGKTDPPADPSWEYWYGRHVMFVQKDTWKNPDPNLKLSISTMCVGLRAQTTISLRVFGPDGSKILDKKSWFTCLGWDDLLSPGPSYSPLGTPPIVGTPPPEGAGFVSVPTSMKPNEIKVFAIEIRAQSKDYLPTVTSNSRRNTYDDYFSVHAHVYPSPAASGERLVHYLPNFPDEKARYSTHSPRMLSAEGGQFWFSPLTLDNKTQVSVSERVLNSAHDTQVPVFADESMTTNLCDPYLPPPDPMRPDKEARDLRVRPCTFVPSNAGPFVAVAGRSGSNGDHFFLHADNVKRYFSATKDNWFDPQSYPDKTDPDGTRRGIQYCSEQFDFHPTVHTTVSGRDVTVATAGSMPSKPGSYVCLSHSIDSETTCTYKVALTGTFAPSSVDTVLTGMFKAVPSGKYLARLYFACNPNSPQTSSTEITVTE